MSIKVNRTPAGTLCYPMHSHKQYEIMRYIGGEGVMQTEEGGIPFSAGTTVVIPPGMRHGSVSDTEFLNVSIECDFDGLFVAHRPLVIPGTAGDEGARLVSMIFENRCKNGPYLHALCVAYAQYLLQRVELAPGMLSTVQEILGRIQEGALDPGLDVNGILKSSGYAEDYVRKCFKREVGRPPLEILAELRIKHACHLIDVYKRAIPLSEIAVRCGYHDYVYFSKKFKEITGLSPRAYRDL